MRIRIIALVFILACVSFVASGQKTTAKPKRITIQGIVADSIGNPVPGASILIDNKKTDVMTDSKGSYKVKARSDAGLISVFTFYNGVDEETIDGRTTINFTMKGIASPQKSRQGNIENDKDINIGYGSVGKENLTGPVNKRDMQIGKNAVYTDIYEMIAGTVPGVKVTGNSIEIRGASSINLSNEPLFVVDGIIVDSIDNIDPSEVESIDVLKGAAATIYGSQAAGGVILIQRKGANSRKK